MVVRTSAPPRPRTENLPIKSRVHVRLCLQRPEPHRRIELRSPLWRSGASPQCLQGGMNPGGDARNRTESPALAGRGRYLSYSSPCCPAGMAPGRDLRCFTLLRCQVPCTFTRRRCIAGTLGLEPGPFRFGADAQPVEVHPFVRLQESPVTTKTAPSGFPGSGSVTSGLSVTQQPPRRPGRQARTSDSAWRHALSPDRWAAR